ncbi:MAG: hypothetical protein HUN05_03980 [Desulfobacter sp.]|nr:MAG: hypothetical protein HUN05_03980 [Desulfobacter sp.]
MGDGRYYTNYQFSVIVFLTLFVIWVCISTVMCVYQGLGQKGKPVFLAHLSLGLASIFRFAHEVLVSQETAQAAKGGELACILITIAAISGLLSKKRPIAVLVHPVLSLISGCILAGAWFHPQWLIQSFVFSDVRLGTVYLWIMGGWLAYAAVVLMSESRLFSSVLFLFPPALYLGGAIWADRLGNWGLLTLYPAWLVSIHIFSADLKSYRIGGQAFANINDLIKDAILVCDPGNNIIFRNRQARDADFLVQEAVAIPGGRPERIFSKDMVRCRKYGFNTFTSANNGRYMDCRTKEIRQGKRLVGRALVICDITDLISMLALQADQKARLEAVNQKLGQYSNIVFDLEKEKEVSSLVTNITQTQEQFMESFRQRIKALGQMEQGGGFDSQVETLIEDAKRNLAEVRDTVGRYRRYYGTKN